MKLIFKTFVLCAVLLAFVSCKQKTTETDQSQMQGGSGGNGGSEVTQNQPPAIDNAATMSFDVAGSDSKNISGLDSIHFEYDKSTLSTDSKKKIQANVDWLKAHAEFSLQIEGHCDARGSIEYNLSLGERRARVVKSYMVSLGISEAKLSTISYGKEKPLVNGDSEEAYTKNRRANFLPVNATK